MKTGNPINLNNMNEGDLFNFIVLDLYSKLNNFREIFKSTKLYEDDAAELAIKDYNFYSCTSDQELNQKLTETIHQNFCRLFEEQFTISNSPFIAQDCSTHIGIGIKFDDQTNTYTIKCIISQKGICIENSQCLKDGILIKGQMLQPNIYIYALNLYKNQKSFISVGPSRINFDNNSGNFYITLPYKTYGNVKNLGMRKISFYCKNTNNINEIPYLNNDFIDTMVPWESLEVLLVKTIFMTKLEENNLESIEKYTNTLIFNKVPDQIIQNNNVNNNNLYNRMSNQKNNINEENRNNIQNEVLIMDHNWEDNNNQNLNNLNNNLNKNNLNNRASLNSIRNSNNLNKNNGNLFFNPNFNAKKNIGNVGGNIIGAIPEENSIILGSITNSNLNSIKKLNNNLVNFSTSKISAFNPNFSDNLIKKNIGNKLQQAEIFINNRTSNNLNNNNLHNQNINPINNNQNINNENNLNIINNNPQNNLNNLQNNIKNINVNSLSCVNNNNSNNMNNNIQLKNEFLINHNNLNHTMQLMNNNNKQIDFNTPNYTEGGNKQNNINNNINQNGNFNTSNNQNNQLIQYQNNNQINIPNEIQANLINQNLINNNNHNNINNPFNPNKNQNFSFNNSGNCYNQNNLQFSNQNNFNNNNKMNCSYINPNNPNTFFNLLFNNVKHVLNTYNIPNSAFDNGATISDLLNATPKLEENIMHFNLNNILSFSNNSNFILNLNRLKNFNLNQNFIIRAKSRSDFADYILSKIIQKKKFLISNKNINLNNNYNLNPSDDMKNKNIPNININPFTLNERNNNLNSLESKEIYNNNINPNSNTTNNNYENGNYFINPHKDHFKSSIKFQKYERKILENNNLHDKLENFIYKENFNLQNPFPDEEENSNNNQYKSSKNIPTNNLNKQSRDNGQVKKLDKENKNDKFYEYICNVYLTKDENDTISNPVFEELYKTQNCYDLILTLKNEEITAHKIVVLPQSHSFKNLVSNNNNTKMPNEIVKVHLPENFKKNIFKEILKFFYTKKISSNLDILDLREMLLMADDLIIFSLQKILIVKYIIPNMTKESSIKFIKDSYLRPSSSENFEVWNLLGKFSLSCLAKNFSYLIKNHRNEFLGMEWELLFKCVEQSVLYLTDENQLPNIIKLIIDTDYGKDIFDLINKLSKNFNNARNYNIQNFEIKEILLKLDPTKPIELPLLTDEVVYYEKFSSTENNFSNINNPELFNNINNTQGNKPNQEKFFFSEKKSDNLEDRQNNINLLPINSKKNNTNLINQENKIPGGNTIKFSNNNYTSNTKFTNTNQVVEKHNVELAKDKFDFLEFKKNNDPSPAGNYIDSNIINLKKHKPTFSFIFNFNQDTLYPCTIITEAFNTLSRSWNLKLDLNKEYDVSLYLIERGSPLIDENNKSLSYLFENKFSVKFNSILFELEIKDLTFEKNSVIFFSFISGQNQIIGYENFFNLKQLGKKDQCIINIWINEFHLHSACLHYISDNFQQLANSAKNKTEGNKNINNNPADEIIKNEKLGKNNIYNVNNNLIPKNKIQENNNNYSSFLNLNNKSSCNNFNSPEENKNIYDLSVFDLSYILYNDNIKIENENNILAIVYRYCLHKNFKDIDLLMNTLRFKYIDFKMLCITARDHKVIQKSFNFKKHFDYEVKTRLNRGTSINLNFSR